MRPASGDIFYHIHSDDLTSNFTQQVKAAVCGGCPRVRDVGVGTGVDGLHDFLRNAATMDALVLASSSFSDLGAALSRPGVPIFNPNFVPPECRSVANAIDCARSNPVPARWAT